MDNMPLSILYYCGDRGLDLRVGEGYRVHVLKILDGLRGLSHQPFLLTVNDAKKLPELKDYQCVPHRYMRGIHHVLPYTGTLDSLHMYKAAKHLHQLRRFNVIHERFGLYSYGAVLAARKLGIPLILEVNGPNIEEKRFFTEPITGMQLAVARFIRDIGAWQAARIIVVSNVLKEFLLMHWRGITEDKIIVMPNAADVKRLQNPDNPDDIRRKHHLDGKIVIGFLGTFQPWYGLEYLIDAFPRILQQAPNARLLFVGDGHFREDMVRQAKKLGLSEAVIFSGYISHEEVPQYLSLFDIAVAPYRDLDTGFFNSPIKLFEYMAAGRAIVASRIGQIPEVVDHEQTALLVEPGNDEQMADAIIRLIHDVDLRTKLGQSARLKGQRYSWEAYAEQLVDVYQSVGTI